MKYGMNMLLWTSDVTEEHYPLLDNLKSWGFDGVELPIFEMDGDKFARLGKKLDSIGLGRTAVTVCTDAENPISPDAAIRAAGLARLKKAIDMCAASGATIVPTAMSATSLAFWIAARNHATTTTSPKFTAVNLSTTAGVVIGTLSGS